MRPKGNRPAMVGTEDARLAGRNLHCVASAQARLRRLKDESREGKVDGLIQLFLEHLNSFDQTKTEVDQIKVQTGENTARLGPLEDWRASVDKQQSRPSVAQHDGDWQPMVPFARKMHIPESNFRCVWGPKPENASWVKKVGRNWFVNESNVPSKYLAVWSEADRG